MTLRKVQYNLNKNNTDPTNLKDYENGVLVLIEHENGPIIATRIGDVAVYFEKDGMINWDRVTSITWPKVIRKLTPQESITIYGGDNY